METAEAPRPTDSAAEDCQKTDRAAEQTSQFSQQTRASDECQPCIQHLRYLRGFSQSSQELTANIVLTFRHNKNADSVYLANLSIWRRKK